MHLQIPAKNEPYYPFQNHYTHEIIILKDHQKRLYNRGAHSPLKYTIGMSCITRISLLFWIKNPKLHLHLHLLIVLN